MRRFGPVLLVLALVASLGASESSAAARGSARNTGVDVVARPNVPVFEIDGFVLRDVFPYSGIGAIKAVPCWRLGDSCSTTPTGAAVADAIWNAGSTTFANVPITDPPQRYELINQDHLRTLLVGDGMPMSRSLIDRAARAGYEAVMVNWEQPLDPTLRHPIGSLRQASQWAHRDGMKVGVAIGDRILRVTCASLGYANCPQVDSPIKLIDEFEREQPFMDEVLKDTDVFTFELQWLVMSDQAGYASDNLELANFMHHRALHIGATRFIYLAEMTTMGSNHSLSPKDYPSAGQYLKSWRGISSFTGPNTTDRIQGLFLLVNGLACQNPGAANPAQRDCHGNPNPGADGRIIQMAQFLRTAFTQPA
jgi:hypothetical protein